jgi:DNA-binding transcriptional LysR family regulator
MKISNLGLRAFYEVASSLNMSLAAGILGVTQSALSQRISALEEDLETALFIREGKSLKLTEAGQNLFLYSQHQKALEDDFLWRFRSTSGEMAGRIRIASYSSILRSKIIPALAPFLRDHPLITVEFSSHEVDELYDVLKSNKADIVISDFELNKKGIIEKIIGNEEYVLIESSRFKSRSNIYLDHDQDDKITELFFNTQKNPPKEYQRSYLGDVYAILDGVELGIGKAVMSKHLVQNREVKIIKGLNKFHRPIVLQYYERPFYPQLFKEFIELLRSKSD